MLAALLLAALFGAQPPSTGAAQAHGVVAGVRVQGNAVTPDDEVIRLAGLRVGDPVDASTPARAAQALKASRRFANVQVLERFASLSDPSQLLIIIIVDEGPLKVRGEGADATISRSSGLHLLFMPLVGYEDGYGFSYGARFAKPGAIGARSRLSFPLTWGGDKRAGVDLEKQFSRGPVTRVAGSFSVSRRTNPHFDEDDDRVALSVRGERQIVKSLVAGASAGVQRVSFFGEHERFSQAGVDLVLDTRLDPMLARNAVYARAAWSRIGTHDAVCCYPLSPLTITSVHQAEFEGRAYVGLPGQNILVLRALRQSADGPLPLYLQPLLGGIENLRGFPAGYKAGDALVTGTAELRVPLTSPLGIAKFGIRAFVDAGTAYQHGEQFSDQKIDRGVGGGVWIAAAVLRLNLDVAHGEGASTRVHFGSSLSF